MTSVDAIVNMTLWCRDVMMLKMKMLLLKMALVETIK